MKLRSALLLPFALLALTIAADHASAQSCTPISVLPYTITQPGTYCLTGNQITVMSSGTAITIAADNVVLDLDGYAIDNLSAGASTTATAILMPQDHFNVTIRNGAVRGFDMGVRLGQQFARSLLVESMRLEHCYRYPILLYAFDSTARANFISNTGGSTVYPNSSVAGITCIGAGLRVLDNDITNTLPTGLSFAQAIAVNSSVNAAAEIVVEGNRIANVGSPMQQTYGISLQNTTTALVIGNRIVGVQFGIYYGGGAVGKYRDNVTFNVNQPFIGGTNIGGNS
jgi:hypothetical protein